MKKYIIEYGKCKVGYTEATLMANMREYGIYDIQDDHDLLVVAVKHFCATHFLDSGAIRLECYDAKTRGNLTQNWQYQPNGSFKGWINASVEEN